MSEPRRGGRLVTDARDGNWLHALWSDATARKAIELISPMRRDEIVRRLKDVVDSEWIIFGSKTVVGHVGDKSLRLRWRINYRNSFQTVLFGTLGDDGSGTRLHCRAGMHPFVTVFMALWLGAVGIGAVSAVAMMLQFSREGEGAIPAAAGFGVVVPFVMVAFGVALVWFGRWLAREERQRLIEFLERTVGAKAAS